MKISGIRTGTIVVIPVSGGVTSAESRAGAHCVDSCSRLIVDIIHNGDSTSTLDFALCHLFFRPPPPTTHRHKLICNLLSNE
jgi:hypothetical protein